MVEWMALPNGTVLFDDEIVTVEEFVEIMKARHAVDEPAPAGDALAGEALGAKLLKEAMAQKGKGYRVQVGTLFGCPIYLDESVPDGEFRLEPAARKLQEADGE